MACIVGTQNSFHTLNEFISHFDTQFVSLFVYVEPGIIVYVMPIFGITAIKGSWYGEVARATEYGLGLEARRD